MSEKVIPVPGTRLLVENTQHTEVTAPSLTASQNLQTLSSARITAILCTCIQIIKRELGCEMLMSLCAALVSCVW